MGHEARKLTRKCADGKAVQSDPSDATRPPCPHPEAAAPTPTRLAVCVATYRRPEGLRRLLSALASASFPGSAPKVDVVVVDNDPEGSSREVCKQARDWLPFELHYTIEKRRGIPQVRNTALAVALPFADFVIITDDDVEPTPEWLAELLRVRERYGADVVTGPNPPRFLDEPPDWIVEGRFFEAQRRVTGTLVDTAATNNVLIRCEVLKQMDHLFDERFPLHGGTDSELFRRVAAAGHRMVWAQEAVVYECIPASRVTLRWLLQRAYRIGNAKSRPEIRRLEGVTRAKAIDNGLRCLARGVIALVASTTRGRVERARALCVLASGVGWLMGSVGVRYLEYRRSHGR
jgi:GT2 family glycosyltransferase